VLFLAWKIGWMGTALYVPCLVLSEISGRMFQPWQLVIVMGFVVTVYTMLGGIKAVVWTEVIQFVVMLTGLAVMVGVVIYQVPGGVGGIWKTAAGDGKTAMVYHIPGFGDAGLWQQIRMFFAEPKTLIGLLIAAVVGRMAGYTGDQVMIQRFQTSKSVKDSRQGFIINALGDSVWSIGLSFVGLGLYAYFKAKGWPAELAGDDAKDHTVPYFLRTVFPTGILGLTLAATLAASLSAIASGINACTTVTMVDFYERLLKGKAKVPQSEMRDAHEEGRKDVALSRAITVVFGLLGMALAIWVSLTGMNVIQIAQKVIQTYTGPMLGIYVLGMFTRRTNATGVLLGGIVGTALALYIAFFFGYRDAAGKWHDYIAFLWPTVFGFVTTCVVGYLLSLMIGSEPSERAKELNWFTVMKRPLPEGEGAAPTGSTPATPIAPASVAPTP
jgi:sodium-coupled monocarboxylate transporter 8/12